MISASGITGDSSSTAARIIVAAEARRSSKFGEEAAGFFDETLRDVAEACMEEKENI